jgi:hypothetical protein
MGLHPIKKLLHSKASNSDSKEGNRVKRQPKEWKKYLSTNSRQLIYKLKKSKHQKNK